MFILYASDILSNTFGCLTPETLFATVTAVLCIQLTFLFFSLERLLLNFTGNSDAPRRDPSPRQKYRHDCDLIIDEHVSIDKLSISSDTEHSTASITECSTICSDSSDEESLSGLSICTYVAETEDEIVERKYNIEREEEKLENGNEALMVTNDSTRPTEHFAAVLIRDRWRQCLRRDASKQHPEKEIYNSHDNRDEIIPEKSQRLYSHRTHSAATLIQVKWTNYIARKDLKVYRAKQAEKKLRYMLVRCEGLEEEFQSFFS